MKTFLAIYTGAPESLAQWDGLPDAEKEQRQKEGIAAWHTWMDKHQTAVVEIGGPLGRTKRVGRDGISDIHNAMSGYTVLRAESHADAAALFTGHPHFSIFPGEAVEVMEILPVPGA
jgi:hypothetical protein